MTQAKGGFGSKIYRDDGTGTFVAVAEVLDVNGPELTQIIEDATNMDSANGWGEKIAVGVREAGDVTFQMHMLQDAATQNVLYSDLGSSTKSNYRLVFPGGTKRLAFAGFVSRIGHSYPVKGKLVNDVTLSITGQVLKEANP
ncbi:MAG: phage tail tube protein [Phycisphaerales bacterium]